MPELDASVAICTYNRSQDLAAALDMLEAQELPHEGFRYEVIVVDNDSSDDTCEVVRAFESRLPIRYELETGRGAGFTRNRALRSFRSELLLFIDDDEVSTTGWLKAMWDAAQRWPDVEVFQGRVLPKWNCPIPEWLPMKPAIQVRSPLPEVDLGEKELVLDRPRFASGNAAIRRSAIEKAGEFHTDFGAGHSDIFLGEDAAYARQLQEAGVRGVYVPTALVYHPVDPQRLNRAYFRKWNRAMGRVRVRIARDKKSRLFGVPVHALREYVETRIRQFYYRLCRNRDRSFPLACRAWKLEGMMYEGWVARWQNGTLSSQNKKSKN